MFLKIYTKGEGHTLSLYHFARNVLGYTKLEDDPHSQWCVELEKRPKRSLWLEPRHTYKSTLFTKTYPIWRLLENPNLRILIVNATAENAENFLSEIVGHYLRNERLLEMYAALFGIDPLDARDAKKKSITLATRTDNLSEPSIGTIGAMGNLTSAHYDIILVDDLCNKEDRESAAVRYKKIRWFQDLPSILSPAGEIIVVGTRWHFDDVYSYIIDKINPYLTKDMKYRVHIDSCYREDGLTARFPNILSEKTLKNLKIEKGLQLFAANYLNTPLAAEHQIFKLEYMHTVKKEEVSVNSESKGKRAYGFCDPSLGSSDFCAIVVVIQHRNKWVVFSADLEVIPQSQIIDKIIGLHKIYNFKIFGIEANLLGKAKGDKEASFFEHVLREKQREKGVFVPYKLIWNTTNKQSRIESLESYFTNGQLCFLESWNRDYPELVSELIHYPLGTHDDGPDALAGCVSLLIEDKKKGILYPRTH